MKKFIFVLALLVAFSGCSIHRDYATGVRFQKPNGDVLPTGFEYQYEAGNGWYIYKSPIGYFLVSVQGARLGYSGAFVEMTFLGKEIDNTWK